MSVVGTVFPAGVNARGEPKKLSPPMSLTTSVPSSVMPPSNVRRKGSSRTGTLVVGDPADGSEPTMVYPYVLPDDWNDPVQVGSPVAPRRTAFTREARDCSASTSPEL